MLQFKRREVEPEAEQPRWNIGVDTRRVVLYVSLALIAGLAGGIFLARSGTPKETPPQPLAREAITPAAPDRTQPEYHRVSRLVRADTIEVEGIGTVRMVGIETPDGKSPEQIYGVHGQRALGYAEKALLGQDVRLEYDGPGNADNQGVVLAYVFTRDGRLINAEMVKQGFALVRGGEQFRMASDFRAFERDAMQSMRGLWGSSSQSPSTAAQSEASRSVLAGDKSSDKPKKLAPLSPSALGENIPALSAPSPLLESSVWVSAADRMYHKSGCDSLKKNKHPVSQSQAKAEGYTACSRCFASTVMKAP